MSRTATYSELNPDHPDLALAYVVVLNWCDAIERSTWDRPALVCGNWPPASPPLIIAGSRSGRNTIPLPGPSARFDFFEIGDDSTVVRALQECFVRLDDKLDDGRQSGDGWLAAAGAIRVLTIDDDGDMRLLIRTILDGIGFQSYFASDGRPGVKMARRIMPNLILLDINMPGASGFDVLSAIRHEPGTSPSLVMLLSASNSELDIRKGCSLNSDAYVTKPFNALNLAARLRSMTSGCRSNEYHSQHMDRRLPAL